MNSQILKDYQTRAARTINTHLSYKTRLMEMGLGICGEVAEIVKIMNSPMTEESRAKMKSEGGDVNWYAAALCTLHKKELSEVFPTDLQPYPPGVSSDKMVIAAGEIADYIKKVVAHGHKMDLDRIYVQLQDLLANLSILLAFYGFDYEEVLWENIEKLLERYPNGFERARSVNREVQQ